MLVDVAALLIVPVVISILLARARSRRRRDTEPTLFIVLNEMGDQADSVYFEWPDGTRSLEGRN